MIIYKETSVLPIEYGIDKSHVFISSLNLFSILPTGILSKNLFSGAFNNRDIMPLCRLLVATILLLKSANALIPEKAP